MARRPTAVIPPRVLWLNDCIRPGTAGFQNLILKAAVPAHIGKPFLHSGNGCSQGLIYVRKLPDIPFHAGYVIAAGNRAEPLIRGADILGQHGFSQPAGNGFQRRFRI